LKNNGVELEMNGNTAESYGWPPEGGGGTVCPDPMTWPGEACRFAGRGDAKPDKTGKKKKK